MLRVSMLPVLPKPPGIRGVKPPGTPGTALARPPAAFPAMSRPDDRPLPAIDTPWGVISHHEACVTASLLITG